MEKYTKGMQQHQYLFISRKGENKPITTVQAYRIISESAKRVGIEEIGTHSMRKTFGYFHYLQYKDVAMLQEILNHSAPSITLRYIRNRPRLYRPKLYEFQFIKSKAPHS